MTASRRLDEFAIIESVFAPLARGSAGALGLRDDAAVIRPAGGAALVASTDMMVAGVHFMADDPPGLVARKLLRANLSDLAAMGARPTGYLLGLAVPGSFSDIWFREFASGLAVDQAAFGVGLLGGDTTAISGPACLSITAFGEIEPGRELRRSGAKPGDDIHVSGTIGDAALALRFVLGIAAENEARHTAMLVDRYRLPLPRTSVGIGLRGLATAAIDVSDGLAADLEHMCRASGRGAEIEAERIPLSPEARAAVAGKRGLLIDVLTGGDDYELLFSVPPGRRREVGALAGACSVPLTRIGRITDGAGVAVLDAAGSRIGLPRSGYRHFGDRGVCRGEP